jgi:hypothetical protein
MQPSVIIVEPLPFLLRQYLLVDQFLFDATERQRLEAVERVPIPRQPLVLNGQN